MRREMEERFGREFGPERPGGFRQGFGGGAPRTPREGEVKVRRTSGAPEKRVAEDVGDYVDFEETKENR